MQAGRRDEPSTKDTTLDETQQNIVNEVRELAVSARKHAIDQLEKLERRRLEISIGTAKQRLREAQQVTEINVERVKADHRDILINARKEERLHLRDLKYFQRVNDIHHEARYPQSKLLHWSVILALLFVESIFNSYFFSLGSDLGLIGGIFQAMLISGVNIVLAIFAGEYGLRQVYHVRPARKAFGASVLSLYLSLMLSFNLAAAHYRSLLEQDPLSALKLVLSVLARSPFSLDNFDSVILFIIGVSFSLAALIKTFTADDRYPGYGAMSRAYEDIRHAYENQKIELRDDVNHTIDEGRREVARIMSEVRGYSAELPDNLRKVASIRGDYANFITEAGVIQTKLLEMYRTTNDDIRTSKTPAYFSDFPLLDVADDLPSIGTVPVDDIESAAQAALDELEGEFDQLMSDLKVANEREIQETTKFIEEIEEEAERRLEQDASLRSSGSIGP